MSVAVGIKSAAEAQVCAEIGCTHGQGLYLGEPRTIEDIRGAARQAQDPCPRKARAYPMLPVQASAPA
jgi:EAL domain-containing protein (putative c-di-GMP-specific phosphodiesterase class I)